MNTRKKSLILIGLFGFLVLLSACAKPLTMKDNGRRLELPIDGAFEVELPGNPTTGFSWELASSNPELVKMIGEPKYEAASSGRIGGGGIYTFQFQTLGAGQSVVVLVYHRPWEKDVSPAETFSVTIVSGLMGQIEEQ